MVEIYIGNTKVDQYKDEAVTVVSSVLDVSDITKNTGDYSKTFSVPASKSNNLLFKCVLKLQLTINLYVTLF